MTFLRVNRIGAESIAGIRQDAYVVINSPVDMIFFKLILSQKFNLYEYQALALKM